MPAASLHELEITTNLYTDRAAGYLILAHASSREALEAMHALRSARREREGRAPTGRTSDQDQDLLRAMLVFACAGADASMKALVEDAVPALSERHPDVQDQLNKFTASFISEAGVVAPRSVAQLLSHPLSPREAIVEEFVNQLTGGSLQSAGELQRVRAALGVEDEDLKRDIASLRGAFSSRNEIIHELDLSPSTERWTRRQRRIGSMVQMANDVFDVSGRLILAVTDSLGDAADVSG